MKPIEFKQHNVTWAKNQKGYRPLPAYTDERETISCWRLTLLERVKLIFCGRLWLRQVNAGKPLQPQFLSLATPFARIPPLEDDEFCVAGCPIHEQDRAQTQVEPSKA